MQFRIAVLIVDLWDPADWVHFIAMTLRQNVLYCWLDGGR